MVIRTDGFPDMLLIAAESMTLTPFLIQSVPCDKGVAGCEKDGSGKCVSSEMSNVGLTFMQVAEAGKWSRRTWTT